MSPRVDAISDKFVAISRHRRVACFGEDLDFTDDDAIRFEVIQAFAWNDLSAEQGMQHLKPTTIARDLIVMVAVALTLTTVVSAEPRFRWWKSDGADNSKAAPPVSRSRKSFSSEVPLSQQTATTPTLDNRRQIAPSNSVAVTKPTTEHWWDRLRGKSIKNEQKDAAGKTSKVDDEVPVVIKKSRPPSPEKMAAIRNAPKSTTTSVIVPNDADDDLHLASGEVERSDVDDRREPRSRSINIQPDLRPRLQIGRPDVSRPRSNTSIQPVTFDSENDPTPPSPVPDLRQDSGKDNGLLPFEENGRSSKIQLRPSKLSDELISLTVRDAPLSIVLSLVAEQHGLNLVAGSEVDSRVTVTLNDVALDEALNALLTVNGYSWHRNRNILIVSKVVSDSRSSPMLRGVIIRVFRLNYISAIDVEKVVTTLLSPAGRAVTTVVDIKSTRRTREEIVVEDLPEYVERIAAYIAEVDCAPRQVLIEAHILQINLEANCIHGVNLQKLFNIGNTQFAMQTTGFANPLASPAFFFGINNNDFHSLVQALTTQTDSKTLATPRVLCLNGQHAKIHIGQQLGFLVTTTTQTSTLQNVNFLNVGVILDVTPVITDEGLVMLHVKPEVSGGQINQNGLPSATTTDVETTVMLADGHGMIIGGLIKEEDTEVQTKVPYLGDLWVVGRLFQQRTVLRQRNEIIIALIPHILPNPGDKLAGMDAELERVRTPLLSPPLERFDRRLWEPDPPDAILNPKHIFSGEILRRIEDPYGNGLPTNIDEEWQE